MRPLRDLEGEIASIRARRHSGLAMSELRSRLRQIEFAFQNADESNAELLRYFPVALVACAEAYFRMAIKDLVDSGEPYLSRAENAVPGLRVDFAVLRSIHGRRFTVGELVAHGAKLSRLEHIGAAMSALLGEDFLQKVRLSTNRTDNVLRGEALAPILNNADADFRSVARAFELRHIICHEIASRYKIDVDEIAVCVEAFVRFLKAADECVESVLSPNAPLTMSEVNMAAHASLEASKTRLNGLVSELCQLVGSDRAAEFADSEVQWHLYADRWARYVADSVVSGGTLWPMIYSGTYESLVESHLDQLSILRASLSAEI